MPVKQPKKPVVSVAGKPRPSRRPAASVHAGKARADQVAKLSWENAIKGAPVPANTRERILHEAVTLLHQEGFAALTQQRVCERAGVRQSHLTYYFPTRNALLREVAVYGCEALLEGMAADIKSLSLPAIRELMFCADESDRRFGRLMVALIVASDEDTSIKPWLASFEAENRAKLTALLAAAGAKATREDIELLHAAYVGAVMLDIGESSPESLARAQRIVHRAFDIVVSGKVAQPVKSARPPKNKS